MSSAPSDPIESLIVHLGQLELTITVRHRDRNTRDPLPSLSLGSSSQPSTRSYSGASWEPVSTAPGFAPGLTHQALQAETAAELAALDLSHLGSARSHLTAQDSVWVPAARLGRAFKAGVVARARLDSEYRTESSPAIPFKNSYYTLSCGVVKTGLVFGQTAIPHTSVGLEILGLVVTLNPPPSPTHSHRSPSALHT